MFQNSADQERDCSNRRLWKHLINCSLLKAQYTYGEEVHVDDVADNLPAKSEVPKSVFLPRRREPSTSFKDLATQKRAPDFKTCNADGWRALVGEQKFERWCYDHRRFEEVSKLWRTELMNCKLVLCSRTRPGRLLFSNFRLAPMVSMWRLEKFKLGPQTFVGYAPPAKDLPIY